MENPYLIPIIVTLVTAMTLGAIYLLVLLLNDGKSDAGHDDEDAGDEGGQAAEPAAATTESAPAKAKH